MTLKRSFLFGCCPYSYLHKLGRSRAVTLSHFHLIFSLSYTPTFGNQHNTNLYFSCKLCTCSLILGDRPVQEYPYIPQLQSALKEALDGFGYFVELLCSHQNYFQPAQVAEEQLHQFFSGMVGLDVDDSLVQETQMIDVQEKVADFSLVFPCMHCRLQVETSGK